MMPRMNLPTQIGRARAPIFDPTEFLLDTTGNVGTTLIGVPQRGQSATEYLLVSGDVIFEYERQIADLRRELSHYRRLLASLLAPAEFAGEFDHQPVIPLDPASTHVVNSIIDARIPVDATFRDFEEGEL